MELLFEQCEQSEELCEECTPTKEIEVISITSEYDYNKRLWF